MPNAHGYTKHAGWPDLPTCLTEAAQLLEKLRPKIHQIKIVLYQAGLSPGYPQHDWELPVDNDQLLHLSHAMLIDVFQIEQLLIEAGLADENEMVPLSPRWRVHGEIHHFRQWQVLQHLVYVAMAGYEKGLPFTDTVQEFAELCREKGIDLDLGRINPAWKEGCR